MTTINRFRIRGLCGALAVALGLRVADRWTPISRSGSGRGNPERRVMMTPGVSRPTNKATSMSAGRTRARSPEPTGEVRRVDQEVFSGRRSALETATRNVGFRSSHRCRNRRRRQRLYRRSTLPVRSPRSIMAATTRGLRSIHRPAPCSGNGNSERQITTSPTLSRPTNKATSTSPERTSGSLGGTQPGDGRRVDCEVFGDRRPALETATRNAG